MTCENHFNYSQVPDVFTKKDSSGKQHAKNRLNCCQLPPKNSASNWSSFKATDLTGIKTVLMRITIIWQLDLMKMKTAQKVLFQFNSTQVYQQTKHFNSCTFVLPKCAFTRIQIHGSKFNAKQNKVENNLLYTSIHCSLFQHETYIGHWDKFKGR